MTRKLTFTGIVQGIGFRPTAKRIAEELNVYGQVKNSGGNVELIISADEQALDEFVRRLIVIFEIQGYTEEIVDDRNYKGFQIVHSENDKSLAFITPDLATCEDCQRELMNESDRRYRHPFISCINCGPRYTIIKSLPYDRENITMDCFDMCSECEKEYTNTPDRRCHAQTIACNDCGPQINMPIDEAIEYLKNGEVMAIKGIGGYHLACSVDYPDSVERIRLLKGREAKPFAVMFRDIDEISEYCEMNDKETELLLSPARPIVLLQKKKDFHKSICSDSDYIGAFLPCNPIQLLILEKASPLVMTSANISGKPIITDDEEIKNLGVRVLSHNREILTPIDDSVVFVGKYFTQFIRRARGYVPLAIDIGINAKSDTLLMGGDLKACFAYHKDKYVFMSQHFGDLEDIDTLKCYRDNIERFEQLHSFKRERIVTDAHPKYYSTNLFNCDKTVYHHEAHCASVIAEYHLKSAICFSFDATGYGRDGVIWGSEVFYFDGRSFERLAHLDYTKMPASDEISRDARLALDCYLGGNNLIDSAIENNINIVESSSMGRLFDAVCSLLEIKHYNSFEGECAQSLESIARRSKSPVKLDISLSPKKILTQIKELKKQHKAEDIALGFHMLICDIIEMLSLEYSGKYKTKSIALGGGVFNNRIIVEAVYERLTEKGLSVYVNQLVPCGDGGLALGQAYINALEEEKCV